MNTSATSHERACCYNVTLNVWADNTSALHFYESLNLKPQKIGMEKILEYPSERENRE